LIPPGFYYLTNLVNILILKAPMVVAPPPRVHHGFSGGEQKVSEQEF
jgi:hypothetical protein